MIKLFLVLLLCCFGATAPEARTPGTTLETKSLFNSQLSKHDRSRSTGSKYDSGQPSVVSINSCENFYAFSCARLHSKSTRDENPKEHVAFQAAWEEIQECQADAILSNNQTDSNAIKQMRIYRDAYIRFELGANWSWSLTKQERRDLTKEIQLIFPLVADSLFVKQCATEDGLRALEEMAESIRYSLSSLVGNQQWIDSSTKEKMLLKNSQIRLIIGALETAIDLRQLDRRYSNINLNPKDSFYEMRRRFRSFDDTFGETDEMEGSRASIINAYNFLKKNTIFFPASLLFLSHFEAAQSMAANYGNLGTIIGHEFAHSFSTLGVHGQLSEATRVEYEKRSACFKKQYDEQWDDQTQMRLNGTRTLDENLCDNIAIKMAYNAYRIHEKGSFNLHNYTSDQTFFISYASHWCSDPDSTVKDSHAPSKFRVNIPLQNFSEFAKAFKCPLGSGMNPKERCEFI